MDQETRISQLEDRVDSMEKEIVRLRKLLSLSSNVTYQNNANCEKNMQDRIVPTTPDSSSLIKDNSEKNIQGIIVPTAPDSSSLIKDNSEKNIQDMIVPTTLTSSKESTVKTSAQVYADNTPFWQNTANQRSKNSGNHMENELGLEGTIGKNVIGMVASALIFIAFLLFGSLIYKQLGNVGKAILLFTASGAILGVGLLLQKKLSNTFSLSIIGCGMGCIYISLIVSNIYFHFLSSIPLYMILLFWLLGMSLLCRKYESRLLCTIGQCGLYLAVLFGITSVNGNAVLWLSVFVFFMIANIFYFHICNLNKHRLFKNFTYLCSILCLLIIGFSNVFIRKEYLNMNEIESPAHGIFLLIAIFLLGYILYQLWKNYKNAADSQKSVENLIALGTLFASLLTFDFFNHILRLELILGFDNRSITQTFTKILTLLFCLGLLLFTEYYVEKHFVAERKNFNLLSVPAIIYLVVRSILCFVFLNWYSYNLLLALAIPLLFYGFYKNKEMYKGAGIFVLFIQVCISTKHHGIHMLLTTAAIFFTFRLLRKYSSRFYTGYKIICYTICLIFSIHFTADLCYLLKNNFGLETNIYDCMLIYFVLMTPLQLLALKTKFCRDWRDLSKLEAALYYYIRIINIILLCFGTNLLYYTKFPFAVYVLLVVLTSALCFTGMGELLKHYQNKHWIGFYIGIKSTVYVSAILKSTPYKSGIFLSILLLLLAILFILLGFKYRLKSFRVYGLFLTMISVVKLILLDIHYSNMIGTIIAFMVCGILCFCINFMYNMLSRHLNKNEDKT